MTLFKFKKDHRVQLFFPKNKVLLMWIEHGFLQINKNIHFLVLKIMNNQNYRKIQAITYQIIVHLLLLKFKMKKI